MKKIISCVTVALLILSVFAGCKKDNTTQTTNTSTATSTESQVTVSGSENTDLSLVAGIWKITSNVIDGKSDDVSKYDHIRTYLYNDGTLSVKNSKSKTFDGTYTFNGKTIITVINNASSVMVVSEDYKTMVATKVSNGKIINTTYTKIAN